jgi:hypothetical protein
MKRILVIFLIIFALALIAWADDKSGEEINWQVLSGGGGDGTSTNYQLNGTVAQTAVGAGTSANYGLSHGYWVDFGGSGGPCDCEPGEANADATINIFDVTYLISFLYMSGPAPVPYALCNGDPNCDCTCNIFDVTYLISFLYMSGPPPCACEEWLTACGPPLRK